MPGIITGVKKGGPLMKSLSSLPSVGYQPLFVDPNGNIVLSDSLPTSNPNDGSWWLNGNTLQKSIYIGIEDSVEGTRAWRASEPSTLSLSGSEVAVWTDYLNGSTMTASAGQGATFHETGGPNNGPYIQRPSGKTLGVDTLPFTTTPFVAYIVARTPTVITSVPLLFLGYSNGNRGFQYIDNNSAYLYGHTVSSSTYINTPRTEWMLITIRFTDSDTVSVEINDEPPAVLIETNGGGSTPYTISALSFIYDNLQIAEVRLVPSAVNNTLNNQIKAALLARHNIASTAKRAIWLTDSHGAGLQSGSPGTYGHPFILNAMNNTGVRIALAGTASTCFNNNNGTNYDFQEIVDNYTDPKWADWKKVICYGTNDCQTASGGYGWTSWSNWQTGSQANVQKFIDNGTDPSDICLITPPYCTNPVVIGNLPTVEQAILDIASNLGAVSINWTQMMIDAGYNAYTHPGSDGIHGNDVQHALVDTPLANFLNS